jgi:hypothetical protein
MNPLHVSPNPLNLARHPPPLLTLYSSAEACSNCSMVHAKFHERTNSLASQLAMQELEEHAEEVVDVLGCYFPIVYTPPAQAKGKVTREELVSGVEQALSAAPAFAQYVLPMLLEKLSSSLRCCSICHR